MTTPARIAAPIAFVESAGVLVSGILLASVQIPPVIPSRTESEALRPENVFVGVIAYALWWILPGAAVWSALGSGAGAALGLLTPNEPAEIGSIVLWCSVIPMLVLLGAAGIVPANGGWVLAQGSGLGCGPIAAGFLAVAARRYVRSRR